MHSVWRQILNKNALRNCLQIHVLTQSTFRRMSEVWLCGSCRLINDLIKVFFLWKCFSGAYSQILRKLRCDAHSRDLMEIVSFDIPSVHRSPGRLFALKCFLFSTFHPHLWGEENLVIVPLLTLTYKTKQARSTREIIFSCWSSSVPFREKKKKKARLHLSKVTDLDIFLILMIITTNLVIFNNCCAGYFLGVSLQ